MPHLKEKGYQAENIVKSHYLTQGFRFIESNWTIPGGEIDLIFAGQQEIVFIEVKCVNSIDELDNYISRKKLITLERAIETYLHQHHLDTEVRLDIAFVKHGEILEIYENISNN